MNRNPFFFISLSALLLALGVSTSWSGPQNPTPSDGFLNTAGGNNAVFFNTSGKNNTGFGANALYHNGTGINNTASGVNALTLNNGNNNTANGVAALLRNSTGNGNTALGLQALFNNTTGSNNLALGLNAGVNLTAGSNNIFIGNLGAAAESATIRIGNSSQMRAFIAGIRGRKTGVANAVAVYIDSNGQLGTINSAQRFKKDIHDMGEASRSLLKLRPVTYHYKQSDESDANPLEYGLIAEEVAKVYPDLVAYGADGAVETVQYHKLTPMLLNEVQHMSALLEAEKLKVKTQEEQSSADHLRIQQQAQEIASLKQQMGLLQTQAQRIEALTSRLSRIEAKQSVGMTEKSMVKLGYNPGL